jgi:hypothetical protein
MSEAIESLAPFWIEPGEDEECQAKFRARPLSGMDALEVMPELGVNDEGFYTITGQGLRLAIQRGLIGWENFTDKEGRELHFNTLNINKIAPMKLRKIAEAIIYRTQFTRGQEKNS